MLEMQWVWEHYPKMCTQVGMAEMRRLVEVVLVLEEVEESIRVVEVEERIRVVVVGDKMVFALNLQIWV